MRLIIIILLILISKSSYAVICTDDQLLFPKIVITSNGTEAYSYAIEVLNKLSDVVESGEAEFYQAAIYHRMENYEESLRSIKNAQKKGYYLSYVALGLVKELNLIGYEKARGIPSLEYKKFKNAAKECDESASRNATLKAAKVLVGKIFGIIPDGIPFSDEG